MAHEIATMSQKYAQEIAKGQMAINQVEAAHKSLFVVAGGPPWDGCAFWMFWELHYYPIHQLCLGLVGVDIVIPLIPLETMMPVSWVCLGWRLRTYEKHKGVHRDK